jgi:hypothetical protein
VACAAGQYSAAAAALTLRILAGVWIGGGILRDRNAALFFFLIPLRDLFGFAVWLGGLAGDTVDWRGQSLQLHPDGKIRKPNNLDHKSQP